MANDYTDSQTILDSDLDITGTGTQITVIGQIAAEPTAIYIGDTLTIDVSFSSPIFDPRCCSGTGVYDEGSFPDTDGYAGWLATIDGAFFEGDSLAGLTLYLQTFSVPGDYTNTHPIYFEGTSFDLTPVPDAPTWTLMLVGLAGIGTAMRTARNRALA